MKNPSFDNSALRALPPEKALRLLAGAAQQFRAYAPFVTTAEALILAGAMGETLFKPVKPEELSHYLGFLVRAYVTTGDGVPSYLEDTSFEEWLETLSAEQAYALSLQAYFFALAREIIAHEETLVIELPEFFHITPAPRCTLCELNPGKIST